VNRLWRASVNSWNGIVSAVQTEMAIRQELVLLALAIPLAFLVTSDVSRRFILVGSVAFLLVIELLNTAIEKLCDRITRVRDESIGMIKDLSSAAVGVSLLFCGCLWLWTIAERALWWFGYR